ncbi:winged helix-turn-helix transcriptional regulator [Qingshengfaniella alkalisoli]|uniref:Helix-turn-helix transcriptional regulator n=1 Tax=Qingshengfaniella alkalisoli TaxID=2599296 RepID=A0A5B8I5X2_9RHOB|nr:helix-turn-helix domain-containing protein [Qingshengfaniella alkalisoli]QDY68799.1 helix-turn-helix transcriptional regulator [Qingshengfaniella alkalisoli]
MKPTRHSPEQCKKATDVISLTGSKWTVLIVMMLDIEKRRFSEMKRDISGISQKMLTTTLRGLERDGYVLRTVYPTVPAKVEYELTDLGRDLAQPLRALGQWALENHDRIIAARLAHDTRDKPDGVAAE